MVGRGGVRNIQNTLIDIGLRVRERRQGRRLARHVHCNRIRLPCGPQVTNRDTVLYFTPGFRSHVRQIVSGLWFTPPRPLNEAQSLLSRFWDAVIRGRGPCKVPSTSLWCSNRIICANKKDNYNQYSREPWKHGN
jgi:hypothetical protein